MLLLFVVQPGFSMSYRIHQHSKADNSHGMPTIYRPPTSGRYTHTSQYVQMDDGTKLAVEVYLPGLARRGKKVPTILEETRYWRVIDLNFPFNLIYPRPLALFRRGFVTHGYAWVVADARAAGASFGSRPWELAPIDIEDHRNLTDWILKQPWSNGKVGLIGHSYAGNLAEFGLLNNHPAVKAAAIVSSPFDLYADILRPGGIPLQPFMHNWEDFTKEFDQNRLPSNLPYGLIISGVRPVDGDKKLDLLHKALSEHKKSGDMRVLDRVDFKDDFAFDPNSYHDPKLQTPTIVFCKEALEKRFGANFLKRGVDLASPSGYCQEIAKVEVPIYCAAGWIEASNANAAIKRFLNYNSKNTRLLLGPWDHNFFNISPYTRGGPTRFRRDEELLKFFDYHMNDAKTGLGKDKRVNYFTLGEERWHGSDTWPPIGKPLKWFFRSPRQLAESPSDTAGDDHYRVDLTAGTGKTSRWDCLIGNPLWAPYPDRTSADKKLLTYDSEPLKQATKITGHPDVNLFIKSDGEDCALFAYLEDVAPNGLVRYVTEGEILAGNRFVSTSTASYKTVVPQRRFLREDYRHLNPHETTEVKIELLPISYQFSKGHRIRVALAGADKDHFAPPKFAHLGSVFDVLSGGDHASYVNLPLDENPL
jgi:putative CocE/NonD family hydrolase